MLTAKQSEVSIQPSGKVRAVHVRLALWILCVLILLPFQAISLRLPLPFSHPILTASMLCLALLLYTTPPTAIRLRIRNSRWILLTGMALLQAAAYASLPNLLRAAILLLAAWYLINLLIRAGLSPWWSVLACWNPVTTIPLSALSAPLVVIDALAFCIPAIVLLRARST